MRNTLVSSSARRRVAACIPSMTNDAHVSLCNISVLSQLQHSIPTSSKQYSLQPRHITFQINNFTKSVSSSSSYRTFSTTTNFNDEYEKQLQQRNKNIIMNPNGYGQQILPGNYVIKKHPKTGIDKKVFLEHALGYFWALKVCVYNDCMIWMVYLLVHNMIYVLTFSPSIRSLNLLRTNQYFQMKQLYLLLKLRSSLH